ncbi:MAG TPA: hypothetical protein PK743_09295 [Luteimonas sp.]|nr:hypothetical protein [Luteimonas sp.]HRO27455.1 hypothetical protein [Luteimonas sp.]HRP72814.1 hypothetical protein [Luteimonas sp.]
MSGRMLLILAAVAVAATVAAAVAVIGLPDEQRIAQLDARRVQDLQRIEAAIDGYARQRDALPGTLDELPGGTDRLLALADPDTGAAYGYEVVDARRYRLCADFSTDSRSAGLRADASVIEGWRHPAGRHCFERRRPADEGGKAGAEAG